MKMVTSFLLTSMLATSIALPTNVFAEEPIRVFVDGQMLNFEVPPIIQEGSTLVPFRTVFEKFGLLVKWDEHTKTVSGSKDGLNIQMTIGDSKVIVNARTNNLEIAPSVINGSTFVPLRFVGEASGGDCNLECEV